MGNVQHVQLISKYFCSPQSFSGEQKTKIKIEKD